MKKLFCTTTLFLLAFMVWSQARPVKIAFDIYGDKSLKYANSLKLQAEIGSQIGDLDHQRVRPRLRRLRDVHPERRFPQHAQFASIE